MATLEKSGVDTITASEDASIPNIIPKEGVDSALASEGQPLKFVAGDELTNDSPITVTVNTPYITCELATDTESLIEI
jgi:hypothetical protein